MWVDENPTLKAFVGSECITVCQVFSILCVCTHTHTHMVIHTECHFLSKLYLLTKIQKEKVPKIRSAPLCHRMFKKDNIL